MVWFCMVQRKKSPHGTVPKCIAARTIEPPLSLFPPHPPWVGYPMFYTPDLAHLQSLPNQTILSPAKPYLIKVHHQTIPNHTNTRINLTNTLLYDGILKYKIYNQQATITLTEQPQQNFCQTLQHTSRTNNCSSPWLASLQWHRDAFCQDAHLWTSSQSQVNNYCETR